ncbi:aspartate aminotransferase family protein [Kordiimonas sediminis]|uniref:Aspartate aminotransferase family protein n=1 Tax=Kordiimonas sediminis TaxID=1735581 RepID=A0A919E540_9PROT|nr:aspartate aminotransferase family protein [Kordiimonas sediminis]GHF14773.1 aspartate aminotransferase family protein [Kordiimonas sediminis]
MTSVLYRSPVTGYPVATQSSGMFIRDAHDKAWLDMSGGAAVSLVGHSHPHVLGRMHAQLDSMAFAHTAFFTNEPQEQLAEKLAARFTEKNARVYFTSGGSEANEAAIKLTWQYWAARDQASKKIIISRENSYHGNTLATLSISGNPDRRVASAAPLLDWPRVSPCYAYRNQETGETDAAYVAKLAQELEDTICKTGADNIAAFICEPIVGASLGVVPYVPGYLKAVRALCDKYDILMISDEIMCGSGRTGKFFAHEDEGVVPDIVTLAKGIAGGYAPLAATIVRQKIPEAMAHKHFEHGHTYVGHALSCAAGMAVQEVIDAENLLSGTLEKEVMLKNALVEATADCAHIGNIRGKGFFYGVEFVSDTETKSGFENGAAIAKQLKAEAMKAGLICYPGTAKIGTESVPHILFAPPLIAEANDFSLLAEKLQTIVKAVFP